LPPLLLLRVRSEALKSLSTMVSEVRADFFANVESADADAAAKGSPFVTQSEDGDDPFAGVPYARLDDSGNAQVRRQDPPNGMRASFFPPWAMKSLAGLVRFFNRASKTIVFF
jgi:hypothetical protein